jgi:hypothetical protein
MASFSTKISLFSVLPGTHFRAFPRAGRCTSSDTPAPCFRRWGGKSGDLKRRQSGYRISGFALFAHLQSQRRTGSLENPPERLAQFKQAALEPSKEDGSSTVEELAPQDPGQGKETGAEKIEAAGLGSIVDLGVERDWHSLFDYSDSTGIDGVINKERALPQAEVYIAIWSTIDRVP